MTKQSLPLVSLSVIMLLMAFSSEAQFKKYKSKTKFNNSDTPPSAENLLDKVQKQEPSEQDAFGRDVPNPVTNELKNEKKYVNLNPETAFGPEVITSFDFPNVSLVDLTKRMQKLTGINLILDKDLKGKVSIMAPSPITVGDAWKAYLTALNINGYTLVKSGAFYKIVNARDIRYTPTKIYTGNYTPSTENYVMRIIPLKNIDSTEVTRSFRPFMSRYGRIIDIKQTNTIIVQDTGSNINRLIRLIKFIDVPGHEESLQIIKLKYSSAQEIAKLLDQILKGQGGRGSARTKGKSEDDGISKIIAEPRTNSIIAMANADGARQLRSLISKLDVKQSSGKSDQIHVYYLNHGDAETLAKTLSDLVSGANRSNRRGSRRSSRLSRDEENSLFSAEVKITGDKDNNALVVTASPTDFITIKQVIKKLDIPRDQVYVEGLIMETTVANSDTFGISLIGATGSGNAKRVGFVGSKSQLGTMLTNPAGLRGLFAGIGLGRSIELDLGTGSPVQVNTINGLIEAIATNTNTNVLATPQILALDNTEATFEVGEQIPTVQTTTAANGTTQTTQGSQEVKLQLKLTPQINKVTRFIKLKIETRMDDFSNRPLPSGLQSQGLAEINRSAITTVVVRDRDTVAMGGLMRDKEELVEQKVPLLGDIPVLGWLFKNKETNVEKVNLMFFLTPKILSPYQKTTSATLKDVINRRNVHLGESVGESDNYKTTMKGLFEKAKKQAEGPLYDLEDTKMFHDQNDGPGIDGMEDEETEEEELSQIPNYHKILQKVHQKASGPVRKQETKVQKKAKVNVQKR